jgi:hypothetical protein
MLLNITKLKGLKVLSFLFLVLVLTVSASLAQKGANKGGGGSPTPTPTPTPVPTNPLPQTPPAPDIIYRESFGAGPDLLRPTGSKGLLKDTYVSTPIQNFWIEYPGSKNTAWIAPAEGQTWRLCGASDNPYEMYSPIQLTLGFYGNGCAISKWTDGPTQNPTALMPFTAPNVPYEVSLNGYPGPIEGKYLALGLTNSAVTYSNLENSGNVVLFLKPAPPYLNWALTYELRLGGLNGTLLASGDTYTGSWNQMSLRYDPAAKTISGNVNGIDLGTFPLNLGVPKYAAFEGVAIADNFLIRKLQ